MSQMTFSDYEYSLRKRKTKREEWVEFVRPYYPNGKRGRPTKGIEKMAADVSCCRSGSISLTRVWKMPSMTAMHSGNS